MSIATTLASLAHAVLVMVSPGVWEAIFGMVTFIPSLTLHTTIPNLQLTTDVSFTGGASAAVAIIVCNMSVIIPATLRALGVGDPFMQEDTADPHFSSIKMARTTSTRIELGLSTIHGTAITDSDESEGTTVGATSPSQQHSVNLSTKDDRKHQLKTQVSDGSIRNSGTTKVVPLADESCLADSLEHVRSLPAKDRQDVYVNGKDGENNNT